MATEVATVIDAPKTSQQISSPDKKTVEKMITDAMNKRILTPEGLAFHLSCHDRAVIMKGTVNQVSAVVDGLAWVLITFNNGYSIRTETIKDRQNLISWTENYKEHQFSKDRQYSSLFGPSDVTFMKTPGQNFESFLYPVQQKSDVPRHRYAAIAGK